MLTGLGITSDPLGIDAAFTALEGDIFPLAITSPPGAGSQVIPTNATDLTNSDLMYPNLSSTVNTNYASQITNASPYGGIIPPTSSITANPGTAQDTTWLWIGLAVVAFFVFREMK